MRNINILGNLLAKDDRELTDEQRRLRASLGIKLPSQMDTKGLLLCRQNKRKQCQIICHNSNHLVTAIK